MTPEERAVQVLVSYLTGRGAELALTIEEHCVNMASDLEAENLLVSE